MKRILLTFFSALVWTVSFAQMTGQFNYGQDGHVYFYLTNNTRYNIPVSVFAHNARNNQSRSDRVTVMAGNTFYFGLNYNWAWERGETMTVTYANGQSNSWVCPQSDVVHQQNYGYTNQQNYTNNGNSGNRLNNIPSEGTTYHFGTSMSMYLVKVFQNNGRRKLSINYSIPAQTTIFGLFYLNSGGYLTPDNSAGITNAGPYNNAQGLFQLNRSKIDFGPNMSYLMIDGKRINKASNAEREQYYQYITWANQSHGEPIGGNSTNHGSNNNPSRPAQGGASSSVGCSNCIRGVDRNPVSGQPSSSWIGHYNPKGYKCPYCVNYNTSMHWHDKCSKCNVPRY